MNRDDVKDLKLQKLDSNIKILYDFFSIYLKMKLFLPELDQERLNLVKMIEMYFSFDTNEADVLKEINKLYGHLEEHSGVDELLDDFDEKFDYIFEYCQDTFVDYETFLMEYGCFVDLIVNRIKMIINGQDPDTDSILYRRYRMNMRKVDFPTFNDEYKNKVLMMLPTLPNEGDDFNGEV